MDTGISDGAKVFVWNGKEVRMISVSNKTVHYTSNVNTFQSDCLRN